MKKLLLVIAALSFSAVAQAQLVFSPGIHYATSTHTGQFPTGDVNNKSDGMAIDLRLGYIMPMGLYLGGMYSIQSGIVANRVGIGTDDDRSGHLIGPTIGYYSMMGFYLLGTYHITGKTRAENSGAHVEYTGAKGPQVDVGWVFPLASSFAIGPQVTYTSIEYSEVDTNTASTTTGYKTSDIRPYVTLWFMF